MLGPTLRFSGKTHVIFDGQEYLFFGGNDYHRLSRHPEVIRALQESAAADGLSSAGSRTTTGNHPLYLRLEERAAAFLGAEGAAVFSSGYLSTLVLLQGVRDGFGRFFIDAAAHSSIADAAGGLPAELLHTFEHSRPEHLEERLKAHLRAGERPLVLTEGVVPGNGEIPPLAEYARLALERGGTLLVDDAHGVGVVGPTGKGSPEEVGLPPGSWIQASTLSKGFGAAGGLVTASAAAIEKVRERSLAFIGSTGVALPLAAAALRSLEILEAHPEMIALLRQRSLRVKERARQLGFKVPPSPAPILSISFGDAARTARFKDLFFRRRIYPPHIHYPGSPPGGHFRFTLSSAHSEEEVEALLSALAEGSR